jgi:hypothetical protein
MIEQANHKPLLAPVMVNVPLGTTRIISFPDEFLGEAISILISNLDAANVASYRIGGAAQQQLLLSSGAFRAIDDTRIRIIEVTAGAAGAVQVEAQVQQFRL